MTYSLEVESVSSPGGLVFINGLCDWRWYICFPWRWYWFHRQGICHCSTVFDPIWGEDTHWVLERGSSQVNSTWCSLKQINCNLFMNDNSIAVMNYSIHLSGIDQTEQTRLHGGKPTSWQGKVSYILPPPLWKTIWKIMNRGSQHT